ncbi:MAG: hypothetical protein ABIE22_02285 [archaeon]
MIKNMGLFDYKVLSKLEEKKSGEKPVDLRSYMEAFKDYLGQKMYEASQQVLERPSVRSLLSILGDIGEEDIFPEMPNICASCS